MQSEKRITVYGIDTAGQAEYLSDTKCLSLQADSCIYCRNVKSGEIYELSVGLYDYCRNCLCGFERNAA